MLRENDYILSRLNMCLDFIVCVLAVLGLHVLRNYVITPYVFPQMFRFHSQLADYWWLIVLLPLFTVISLRYYGYYESQRVRAFLASAGTIILASIVASLAAAVVSFIFTPRGAATGYFAQIFSGEYVSRGILLLYPPVVAAMLLAKNTALRTVLLNLRNKGYNTRHVLLVGEPDAARKFTTYLGQHPYWGFKVAGLITESGTGADPAELPVLGAYNDLVGYLEKHVVDDVIFVPGANGLDSISPLLRECDVMGVRTRLPINLFSHGVSKPVLDEFDELSVITFNPVRMFGRGLFLKYALDRIVAFFMLILFAPVMLVIYLLIKGTSASWSTPAFYGQKRCGLHGRQFTLWKFRSMRPQAEQELTELRQLNEMTGPVFKIKNDPRVTPIGKWLRKFSLDELPQFLNVLQGDMSLVGPRPALPQEVEKYDRWQRRRLSMKPGITCLWQVSGRNKLSFETWMKLDLHYIDNWSLWLDCKILIRTIYVVATGYGAM